MSLENAKHTVTTSVRMPVELRCKLEHVRLVRAQRGMRLPRLRDLVLEALALLVASETGSSSAGD